jgi:transposase
VVELVGARVTDLGPDHVTRHLNPDRHKRNHIRQLEAPGYTVTLTPAA